MQDGTAYMIGTTVFVLMCFILLLSTNTTGYDDVISALFFLTTSSIILMRVVFNYLDDLAFNMNDYLYTAANKSIKKMIHTKGFESTVGEERWTYTQ
jgi:hypothetical protein